MGALVVVALLLLGLVAPATARAEDAGAGPTRAWTLLVYMAADNNLERFATQDLQELAGVAPSDRVEVLVLVDRADGYSTDPVAGAGDFDDTRLLRLRSGRFEVLDRPGELDMADPRTLAWFVEEGFGRFPAERRALVLWDHGSGWTGFGQDEEPSSALDLPAVSAGLASGLSKVGGRVDLLGFDACLMADVDVAAAMAPHARYLVASEELEPVHGWDYASLSVLARRGTSGADLGRAIVEGFHAQAVERGKDADVTLALLDLDRIAHVNQALHGFARAATEAMAAIATPALRARAEAVAFAASPLPEVDPQQVDLGDVLRRLGPSLPAPVLAARSAVLGALRRAVVARVAGPCARQTTGLSVYFPRTPASYRPGYDDLPDRSGWRGFLKALHDRATTTADAAPTFASPAIDVREVAQGLRATADLADGGSTRVASAAALFGTRDPDGAIRVLETRPAVVDAGRADRVQAGWGYDALELTDGAVTATVHLRYAERSGCVRGTVPIRYRDERGVSDGFLDLVLAPKTFTVTKVATYVTTGDGLVSEAPGMRGDEIVPMQPVVRDEAVTFEPIPATFDAAYELRGALRPVAAGTPIGIVLTVSDRLGRSSSVVASSSVPA